jgi:hypothetical protein
MPIQLTISQETGVNATYHVVQNGDFAFSSNRLSVTINSYLDQPSFAAGKLPLANITIDCSPIVSSIASTPPDGATMQQVIEGIIETYLLTTQTFEGAKQVG